MHLSELLTLPAAHGGPVGRARVRATPEDFVVREWLGFEADGAGDHVLLTVRKRGANTMWVAKQLARIGKLDAREVGYAGLKDRDAVAVQHYTVPARSAVGDAWPGVQGEGFEVLAAARHRRKLKRGALRGNAFELRLRDFEGDGAALGARLQTIAAQGAPNYFGPQRFGRAGGNLATAAAWFGGAGEPDRAERGFALSAARAALFNAVLATSGDVAALEIELAERYAAFSRGLERAGLEQERRALRTPVRDLEWSMSGGDVSLRFRLPRGSFATAVLHELLEDVFATEAPDSGE